MTLFNSGVKANVFLLVLVVLMGVASASVQVPISGVFLKLFGNQYYQSYLQAEFTTPPPPSGDYTKKTAKINIVLPGAERDYEKMKCYWKDKNGYNNDFDIIRSSIPRPGFVSFDMSGSISNAFIKSQLICGFIPQISYSQSAAAIYINLAGSEGFVTHKATIRASNNNPPKVTGIFYQFDARLTIDDISKYPSGILISSTSDFATIPDEVTFSSYQSEFRCSGKLIKDGKVIKEFSGIIGAIVDKQTIRIKGYQVEAGANLHVDCKPISALFKSTASILLQTTPFGASQPPVSFFVPVSHQF